MGEDEKAVLVFLMIVVGFLVLMIGGIVVGVFRHESNKRNALQRREALHGPEPVCGCGEHFSFHDPATGRCMKEKKVATKWKPDDYDDGEAIPTKWEMRVCGCQRYTGPQPMPELYAQPFSTSWSPQLPPADGAAQDYMRQMRDSAPEEEPDPIQVEPGLRSGQHRPKKMVEDQPEGD